MSSSPPNPAAVVDAIVAGGRLYGQHVRALLPLALVLEALKVVLLINLIAMLGEDLGTMIGAPLVLVLLVVLAGAGARVAVDDAAGATAGGPLDLLWRLRPSLGSLAALALGATLIAWTLAFMGPPWRLLLAVFPEAVMIAAALSAAPRRADGTDPTVETSLRHNWDLAKTAVVPVLLLAAFQLFASNLYPALADSAVGRKAPNEIWMPVEAAISAVLTPIVAMILASFFLDLGRAAPADPAKPAPGSTPGGPPAWQLGPPVDGAQ